VSLLPQDPSGPKPDTTCTNDNEPHT
jgi:hypothetical protein